MSPLSMNGVSFQLMKCSFINILNTTKLLTFKWLIVCYMSFTSLSRKNYNVRVSPAEGLSQEAEKKNKPWSDSWDFSQDTRVFGSLQTQPCQQLSCGKVHQDLQALLLGKLCGLYQDRVLTQSGRLHPHSAHSSTVLVTYILPTLSFSTLNSTGRAPPYICLCALSPCGFVCLVSGRYLLKI